MTPDQWARATLGEVVLHLGRGTSPKYVPDSTVFAVNQKCVRHGRVTTEHARPHEPNAPVKPDSVLRPGDLCVNSTGTGTIGRVGLWDSPKSGTFFADTHVTVVRPNPEKVVSKFLSESLLSPWVQREMEVSCFTGSTNQIELSKSAFSELALLLPPLGEQRKIATILASLDEAIEATQAIIDQLQVVKKAMMAELLTRGMPGRHTRFKQTEIGEVPEDWTTVTYGELAAQVQGAIQSGPFGSELKHSEFTPNGRLVIGIDNVLDGRFSLGSEHRIPEAKFNELKRFEARPLDLLITVMATVGRCCVVPEGIEPSIITKHVYRLTVDQTRANPFFLMYCLYGIQRLANEVRGSAQGLTRPGLNKSLLLPLRFPLPPFEEQNEIVGSLQAIDERTARESEVLSGLGPLKAALMSVLLTGEVRVKPDEEAA